MLRGTWRPRGAAGSLARGRRRRPTRHGLQLSAMRHRRAWQSSSVLETGGLRPGRRRGPCTTCRRGGYGRRLCALHVQCESDGTVPARRALLQVRFERRLQPIDGSDRTRPEPIPDNEPYPISYRSLTPSEEDARNLLNPVTLSATNLAYSSIRMEPTFMMLGEAAGTAAALSVESNVSVQELGYASLRRRLMDSGQRLAR